MAITKNQQHYMVDWILNHDAIFENVTIVEAWILATGFWSDSGFWQDDQLWVD